MTYYDDIYEIAVDNHYLVTTAQAAEAGVPTVELAKLAHRGRLENVSRGLYRLARRVPHESDPYAEAVARVGEGAYLCGESVIALLGLAPTNPAYICVAAPGRTRRKLPAHIRLRRADPGDEVTSYEGVRSQSAACAIRAASATVMGERLRAAADEARRRGLILREEQAGLREEMGWE